VGKGQVCLASIKHRKAATHILKCSERHHQLAQKAVRHDGDSLTGDPKTGTVSRLKKEQDMAATHPLKS
jgi:hypothetical protein